MYVLQWNAENKYMTFIWLYTDRKSNDGGDVRIRPEILDDVRVEDLVNEYLNSQENVSRSCS